MEESGFKARSRLKRQRSGNVYGRFCVAFGVFLSHSSSDQALVSGMREIATTLGCTLYVYTDDPQGGRNVFDKVKERIGLADAMVVLLTDVSVAGAAVQQEVGAALALGKPIVPVKAKNLDHRGLGFLLDREWIEVDTHDPTSALADIHKSLARLKGIAERNSTLLVLFLAAVVLYLSAQK
jgi:hypothetical protein